MKKIFTLLSFIACMASTAFAQIIVDGNLNEGVYTTLATRGTSVPSFGSNIDATSIKITQTAGVVYIGVTGFLDPANSNAIGLMLNFSSTSHPTAVAGAAAGTDLRTAGGGGFINYHVKTGFEVDYMFNLNPGGSTTNCYVNGAKKVGGSTEVYLGNIEQTTALTYMAPTADVGNGTFFASAGVEMAFRRDLANANAGFEMKIPFSALGLSNTAQLSVQAFAFVCSNDGFYSNITIPGTPATPQLGQDGLGNFVTGDPTSTNPQSPTINFGPLAGGPYFSTFTTIPVEMTNFDATASNNTVKLNWLTASEKNNGYFDVERSANGWDFTKIGHVKGNGTTSAMHKYAFVDESPLATVNYYRLKQVDADGRASHSATVSVNIKSVGKSFSVYPNPANDRLNLVSDRFDTEGSFEIYDLAGRLVLSGKSNANQLDISRLNTGLYQLRLLDKTGATVNQARFSKN
jgi:Secretion system C-terminal sorting domain